MEYVNTYREFELKKVRGLRRSYRNLVLSGLVWKQKVQGWNFLECKPHLQILYLHHVFVDEQEPLRRLLTALAKNYTFISYSEATSRILQGGIDRAYLAFSMDDGLKCCRDAAAVFEDFGVRACFFVCPSLIGETNYDRVRDICLRQLHIPPVEFLSWRDIDALMQRGHEIGSHTMDHVNLAQCTRGEACVQIGLAREKLASRCGPILHFAFPYGQFSHFSQATRHMVFGAGYQTCASAVRGCHVPRDRRLDPGEICIRRHHCVAAWPLAHTQYFLTRSAAQASSSDYFFPY